jgi:hypothetical protein
MDRISWLSNARLGDRLSSGVISLSGNHSRGPKTTWPTNWPTFRYDPVRETKIVGITGVTVGLILWAWALNWTAQIVWYGFWSIFNTLTGGD